MPPCSQFPDDMWNEVFTRLSPPSQRRFSAVNSTQRNLWRKIVKGHGHPELPIQQAIVVMNPLRPVVPPDEIHFHDGLIAAHAEWVAMKLSRFVENLEWERIETPPLKGPKPVSEALRTARNAERHAWLTAKEVWEVAKSTADARMIEMNAAAKEAAECAPIGNFWLIQANKARSAANTQAQYSTVATAKYEQAGGKVRAMLARDGVTVGDAVHMTAVRSRAPVARVSLVNHRFNNVLLSDNSLWSMDKNSHEWSLSHSGVVSLAGGHGSMAFVLQNGIAMMEGYYKRYSQTHKWSNDVRLNGERAVHVCCENHVTYFLTARGSICRIDLSGGYCDQESAWYHEPEPASLECRRLEVANGPPPEFVIISGGCRGGFIAADREGRLYVLGSDLRLRVTPDPPVPVRDVLVPYGYPKFSLTFQSDDGSSIQVEEAQFGTSTGGLALLVDGTVWSVLGQRRLTCTDVIGLDRGSSWWGDDSITLTRLVKEGNKCHQVIQDVGRLPANCM